MLDRIRSSLPASRAEVPGWLRGAIRLRAGVDPRALAALRIALGTIVITDLLLRASSLRAFYTDEGVLPRLWLSDPLSPPYSVHAFFGSVEAQAALFAFTGVAAFCMLVGYRTRLATVVTWLMMLSLMNRNLYILNSGDVLLRSLLFWGMFVPLGERWSLDAARIDRDRSMVATVATVGLMVQGVLVYSVNAIHKLHSDEWVYGNATGMIMHLDQFTILLGPHLAEYPTLTKIGTVVWVVLLPASPLLLVLTGWRRTLLAVAFAGMHFGMALTMKLGIFPFVSMASMLPFVYPGVWNRLETGLARIGAMGRAADARDAIHRRDPLATVGARLAPPQPPGVPSWTAMLSVAIPLLFVPMIIVSGAASVDYAENPEPSQYALYHADMDQSWQMFAPNPLSTSQYYVARANTTDGDLVNPFPGATTTWDRPPNGADTVRNERWRKYLKWVQGNSASNHPDYFANYLCEEYERTHGEQLANLSVHAVQWRVGPEGAESDTQRDKLVEYDCTGDLIQAGG